MSPYVKDPGLFTWPTNTSPVPPDDGTTWTAIGGIAARIPPPSEDADYILGRRAGQTLPEWVLASGAVPPVVSDLYDLQEALADIVGLGGRGDAGGILNLAGSQIVMEDLLTIQGVRWLKWFGGELVWTRTGTPDRPLLKLIDCADSVFESVVVTCDEPLLEAVRLQAGPTATGDYIMAGLQSSHNVFRNWTIRGQDQIGVGFRLYLQSLTNDVRNDHMRFIDCRVAGFRHSAYHLEGRNAKDIIIQNPFTQGISPIDLGAAPEVYSRYGIDTVCRGPEASGYGGMIAPSGSEIFNKGAAFSVGGPRGQISACELAVVRHGDRAGPVALEGIYCEKSGRLLDVPNYGTGASGALTISLKDVHFTIGSRLAADGEVIRNFGAALKMDSCMIGRGADDEQGRIRHETDRALVMNGCQVSNGGDGNVFTYNAPKNSEYTQTNDGFRDGEWGELGVGVVVPTDGPLSRPMPRSKAQWKVAALAAGLLETDLPSSQYKAEGVLQISAWGFGQDVAAGDFKLNGGNLYQAKKGGRTASSGTGPTGTGTGITDGVTDETVDPPIYQVVWNYYDTGANICRDIIGRRHAVIIGSPLYAQTETGWIRNFIQVLEASGASMRLNYTGYSPATAGNAILAMLRGRIIANTGSGKLIQLGGTNTSIGGNGLLLEVNSAGQLFLCHNGDVNDVGTYVYEGDSEVHDIWLYWDYAIGRFVMWSDEEAIEATPATPLTSASGFTPANNATKGIGANSGEPPNFTWSDLVWFEGAAARAWASVAGRTYFGLVTSP